MEFSQIFGFLKIYTESIKLIFKNVKAIASITAVSNLLSSILFLIFIFIYQTAAVSSLKLEIFIVFILVAYLCLLAAYLAIANASWIATVIATAASYNDGRILPLQEVFNCLKAKWTSPFRVKYRRLRDPKLIVWLIITAVAVVEVLYNPKNPFWIVALSVAVFACFVSLLYTAAVRSVAAVIPAVEEDGCEAVAVERAEKLVQGRRLDGFMVNLLFSILYLILVYGFWMIVGDRGSLNLTVYGLFVVNSISVMRVFAGVMYTVYYFRCREFHDEEIDFLRTPLVNHLT